MFWWKILPIFLVILFPPSVYAAFSFSISAPQPTTISDNNREIPVSFTVSGLPSPSYFRVAFQKSSGSVYFGQIKNDSGNWVDITALSGDCHGYYYVPDTSTASFTIQLRVGSNVSPDPGQYLIRAHRFTQSACSATEANNSLTADFIFATPTPIPSPTSKPPIATPTTGATSTPKPPTSTPTAKLAPSSTPIPKTPTPKPTLTPKTTLPAVASVKESQPSPIPIFTPTFTSQSTKSGDILSSESSSLPAGINLLIDSSPEKSGLKLPLGAFLIAGGGTFFLISAFLLLAKSGKISF